MNARNILASTVLLMACSGPAIDDSDVQPERHNDTAAVERSATEDSLVTLIDGLRRIEATYRLSGSGAWEFTGDRNLFESIRSFRDEAVEELVMCLASMDQTATTIGDRSVPLGVLCYQALSEVAYYEAVDGMGDLEGHWPGYILPTASPEDLVEAHKAWEGVVSARLYILYP